MSKEKCGYCGKEIDIKDMVILENGSPACSECAAKESKDED